MSNPLQIPLICRLLTITARNAAVIPSPAPSDEASPRLPISPPNSRSTHIRETSQPLAVPPNGPAQGRQPSPGEALRIPDVQDFETLFSLEPQHLDRNQPATSAHIVQAPGDGILENPPLPAEVLIESGVPNRPFNREELRSPSPDEDSMGQRFARPSLQTTASLTAVPQTYTSPSIESVNAQVPTQILEDPQLNSREGVRFPGHIQQNFTSQSIAANSTSPSMTPQPQIRPSPRLGSFQEHPNKRRRVGHPLPTPLKSRIDQIETHIRSVGGHNNLNTGLERPRFQLLKEACLNEDLFYVALHQVFVIWSIRPDEIANITGFPAPKLLHLAFGTMGQLIRDNTQLAPNHLKWFSEFPAPLHQLLAFSDTYPKAIAEVGNFLGKLASDWASLSLDCRTRGYPPLVDELVNQMGLLSPIFQGVLFTAIRRNLDIGDGDIGARMENLFKKDQQDHQSLAARYNSNRPPTVDEINRRNDLLAREYTNLHQQLIQRRASIPSVNGTSVTGVSSPVVSGNILTPGSTQSPDMIPQPHQAVNRVVAQEFPSGVILSNTIYTNQSTQPMPRRTISSPNSSIPATSPLNRGQQVAYSDTPSPTLLQGLSMQSPVLHNFPQTHDPRRTSGQVQVNQNGAQAMGIIPSARSYNAANATNQPILQRNTLPTQQHVNMNIQQSANQQMPSNIHLQQSLANMNMQQRSYQQMTQQQLPVNTNTQQRQGQPISPNVATQHHPQANLQQGNNQQIPQYMAQQQQQYLTPQQVAQQQRYIAQMQQNIPAHHQQQSHAFMQHQHQQNQQAIAMNRAGQLPSNAPINVDISNRVHSRSNSVGSGGRQTPNMRASTNSPRATVLPQTNSHEQARIACENYAKISGAQRPLFPPIGFAHPPRASQPEVTALHQAHLRSPRLVPATIPPPDIKPDSPALRHYQVIRDCIVPPTKLGGNLISHFDFVIPQQDFKMIPVDIIPGGGQTAVRQFKRGMLQYRLRCISMRETDAVPSMSQWAVNENLQWPDTTCLEINGHRLEIRRKNHHGKDLPVDITHFVQIRGLGATNRVTFVVTRSRNKMRDPAYLFAVEVIEIFQHGQILEMCQKNRVPANVTLDKIKKSLAPLDDDDDDVAIAASDLSIDLADPYTARIFVIPVRGNNCLHRECFDLDTFLETRNSKPKRPQQPTLIDMWRCPICSGDARPQNLLIDDFLASVRDSLMQQGLVDVKAIWIDQHGKWRPKVDEKTGVSGDGDGYDESDDDAEESKMMGALKRNAEARNSAPRNRGGALEVINLDDD